MEDPVKYHRNNEFIRNASHKCLVENIGKITWHGKDRVLDIGSGDGSFTAITLKRFLPAGFEELVGGDKNKNMLKFANEHYAADNISFVYLEVGGDVAVPDRYNGYFHHVFSFYTFHFIKDQRKAFSHVYNLLAEGGDCLLNMIGHLPPFFEIWRILSETDKWKPWIKKTHVEGITFPYHDSLDAVKEVSDVMSTVGFKNIDVKYNKLTFFRDAEHSKTFLRDLSMVNVPEHLYEEYFADYMRVGKENGFIEEDGASYQWLLVIYGIK